MSNGNTRDCDRTWYYTSDRGVEGPFTRDHLHQSFEKGYLDPERPIWRKGDKTYRRAKNVFTDSNEKKASSPVVRSSDKVYKTDAARSSSGRAEWYCLSSEGAKGPFTAEQFELSVQSGRLAPDTPVWREGETTRRQAREVFSGEKERAAAAVAKARTKLPITLRDDGFDYKGRRFPYECVLHIGWYAVHTKMVGPVLGLPTGSSYDNAWLQIHPKGWRKPLKIKAGATLFATFRNTALPCRALQEVYLDLSERTFRFRLRPYTDQLRHGNYFVYAGWRFHANGDIVANDGEERLLFNMLQDRVGITQNPFQLYIRRETKGVVEGIKSHLGERTVPLQIDRDIFCYLVYNLYDYVLLPADPPLKRVYAFIREFVDRSAERSP
jgi:hypothetical protein